MDEPTFAENFGYRVMRRRLAVAKTQREVCAAIGMATSQYSGLEAGKQKTMQLEQLVLLARALLTTTDFLLGLSSEAGPVPPRHCLGEEPDPTGTTLLPAALALESGAMTIVAEDSMIDVPSRMGDGARPLRASHERSA
jgi:transcriptional regulator with XRE-family HTH domain